MQALFAFVTGPDVLSSITGWTRNGDNSSRLRQSLLVLAAEKDVLCTPSIMKDAAQRYQEALTRMVVNEKFGDKNKFNLSFHDEQEGVRFRVVKGLAHHLQNHQEWERGADEIRRWVEQL